MLPFYDVCVWIDDDILITRPETPLEDFFTDEFCTGIRPIIIQDDAVPNVPMNTGFMLVRNTQKCLNLLDAVWNSCDLYGTRFDRNCEQTTLAMIHFNQDNTLVDIVPYRRLHSFVTEWMITADQIWQPGDFSAHFLAGAVERRVQLLDYLVSNPLDFTPNGFPSKEEACTAAVQVELPETIPRQVVRDYELITPIPDGNYKFTGVSCAEKKMIFNIFKDLSQDVKVLDIGFGIGTLGTLIKTNAKTRHWAVDGIEGFEVCCRNTALFQQKIYRNIWHGYAQNLGVSQLQQYDVLCLLDVIEHLNRDDARKLVKTLLSSMRDDAFLFISTPLWFAPQDSMQEGDLEEHVIGVPASSMLAMRPLMYTVSHPLVGNFVFTRASLGFVDLFQPTTEKSFSYEKGACVASAVGLKWEPGVVYMVG